MFKKNALPIFLSLFMLFFACFGPVKAEDAKKVEIDFFSSPTCPHCASQKKYFKELQNQYPEIVINEYDFSGNTELAGAKYQEYNVPQNQQGLIPLTFIKDSDIFFVGFNDKIAKDIVSYVEGREIEESSTIKIPFGGRLNAYDLSLPVLAITLGVIDGFNVCSLGALIIILGLVMVLRSRKRIMLLGGTFVLVTGITYGILILLWHQLFTFISPYIKSMEILIAILSFAAGAYLFKEFLKSYKQGPSCSSGGIIAKLSPKVEKIFSTKKNITILMGIVALFALAVTIIEFPCSAVLPMIFTSILVEAGVSTGASLAYIGLYLLFYMLDELIIFLIAIFTMELKIVSPKFIIFFNLLAAVIFLFLGLYYLTGAL